MRVLNSLYLILRKINYWLDTHSSLLSAWASVFAILGVPLILIGGYSTYIQIKDYLMRPSIALYISNPEKVRFRLVNISPVILRKPKYQFAFWDLDARIDSTKEDPGNLKIHTRTEDYILPKSYLGPWSIMELSNEAMKVPKSHIVFGWASLQCPDCENRKHYWVHIKNGESAWYSEIQAEDQPSIWKNLSAIIEPNANYARLISELVPLEKRIAVMKER
jgi:hypothetical protein